MSDSNSTILGNTSEEEDLNLQLQEDFIICAKCGAHNDFYAKECTNCGVKFKVTTEGYIDEGDNFIASKGEIEYETSTDDGDNDEPEFDSSHETEDEEGDYDSDSDSETVMSTDSYRPNIKVVQSMGTTPVTRRTTRSMSGVSSN